MNNDKVLTITEQVCACLEQNPTTRFNSHALWIAVCYRFHSNHFSHYAQTMFDLITGEKVTFSRIMDDLKDLPTEADVKSIHKTVASNYS